MAEHCTTVRSGHAECTCGWRSSARCADLAFLHRLAVGETIDNPYLHAFLAPLAEYESAMFGGSEFVAMHARRDRLVAEYAWAIPTETVLRKLAELSPICELGCGTGYWAKLLADVGARVLAVDPSPPLEGCNHWHRATRPSTRQPVTLRHFAPLTKSDAATFTVPDDHTLMLCWPPYDDDMASVALARYHGDRVIYIGEDAGGCTGDEAFHAQLAAHWDLSVTYEIPHWETVHDAVNVYTRKPLGDQRRAIASENADG